jgi:hypothetical protein
MSEHLLEMAKALVRVKDGKIEVLTDPGVRCCPLRKIAFTASSKKAARL